MKPLDCGKLVCAVLLLLLSCAVSHLVDPLNCSWTSFVQCLQSPFKLCQGTGVDNVRHRLDRSAFTQVAVGLPPPFEACSALVLC